MHNSLLKTGQWLRQRGYHFTTVTPGTHERVNSRPRAVPARDLRGIFGWSRPFAPALLDAQVRDWLDTDGLLSRDGDLLRSRVRFSSLGTELYAHSAYPTSDADAVFFGPDTYRFVAAIEAELARMPLAPDARILDVGCGAGPGGIAAALASPAYDEIVLADINPRALNHARANAQLAVVRNVSFAQSDLYHGVDGQFDLIVANPPYLVDSAQRTYRHGGGPLGGGLSERIVAEGLPRLAPGGRLLLYTGAAMLDGHDPLLDALRPVLRERGWPWSYREIDPDVFGEELDAPAYAQAERIAAVALVVQRPA